MSLPFDMYLSSTMTNVMRVFPQAEYATACLSIDTATIVIHEVPVCFLTGAGIQLSSPLKLIVQNHASTLLVTHSSLNDTLVSCEILNTLGETVWQSDRPVLFDNQNMVIPISKLSTGLYYFRLLCGSSYESQQFFICR
jgi:hypothetical protein